MTTEEEIIKLKKDVFYLLHLYEINVSMDKIFHKIIEVLEHQAVQIKELQNK